MTTLEWVADTLEFCFCSCVCICILLSYTYVSVMMSITQLACLLRFAICYQCLPRQLKHNLSFLIFSKFLFWSMLQFYTGLRSSWQKTKTNKQKTTICSTFQLHFLVYNLFCAKVLVIKLGVDVWLILSIIVEVSHPTH